MYGARTTLIVAIGSRVVALVTGAILGLLCGYYTPMEKVLMRILKHPEVLDNPPEKVFEDVE